ncbi:MAG: hypothetical protein BAJATHORv1_80064 [Candidatus Thorarchaeota archaeon]|nr:MAG: hypothetical protein BAJATHORv1_80064 [Candidatus Thorarchaeota archaeon]
MSNFLRNFFSCNNADGDRSHSPVAISFLDSGGIPIYTLGLTRDECDHFILGGFIKAAQHFFQHFFQQNICYFELDTYGVLLHRKDDFTAIYLFIGSRQSAEESLRNLVLRLIENPEVLEALHITSTTGKSIDRVTQHMMDGMAVESLEVPIRH